MTKCIDEKGHIYNYYDPNTKTKYFRVCYKRENINEYFKDLKSAKKFRDGVDKKRMVKYQDLVMVDTEKIYPVNLMKDILSAEEFEGLDLAVQIECWDKNFAEFCASSRLNKRSIKFILERYKKYKTLEQIGTTYNLTRERVRQILAKTLLTLKAHKYELFAPDLIRKIDKIRLDLNNKIDLLETQKNAKICLEDLHIKEPTMTILERNGITTLEQLCGLSFDEFIKLPHLGMCKAKDIFGSMAKCGIWFKE